MKPVGLLSVLLASFPALSCGGGSSSNRQLQSITIQAVSPNGGEVFFTATGTYNAPPITVTPLPTFWVIQDPPDGYQLTTQPFPVSCAFHSVSYMAPVNPNAPSAGPIGSTPMITGSAQVLCP